MSYYHYTDGVGDGLHVQQVTSGELLVRVSHNTGKAAGIGVPLEEAAALALAILEAAGIKPAWDEEAQSNPERWASKAVEALTYSVKHRAEIAAREAEDAKALAFRKVIFPGIRPGASITPKDRDNYNAARKFFEGEE